MLTIVLGLLGLGFVVFFHELGHFLAARIVGVEVEEFSLGWGPRLVSKRLGKTSYTLSALPIGGYCRMKGEDSYRKAVEHGLDEFPREPGSYFGASPIRRIIISLGGPLLNVVFAFAVYSAVIAFGYETRSFPNRVILASEIDGSEYPADRAGLKTGDVVVSISGKPTPDFSAIQERVAMSARQRLDLVVERSGALVELSISPELNKETGGGRIGIYPWIDPVVGSVSKDGPASPAGLKPGDRIVSIDGRPVAKTLDVLGYLQAEKPGKVTVEYERRGAMASARLILDYADDGSPEIGVLWQPLVRRVRAAGFAEALSYGLSETTKAISATYKGIASLFMGVDVLKAVSGPVRIIWMVGSVASEDLSGASGGGVSTTLGFLAMLSIGLFVMNMLPIPLLDGGSILLFAIEFVRGKAAKVKTVLRYQTIGMIVVAAILVVSTVGDVLFLPGK